MNKKDMRNVMDSLAKEGVPDDQVLKVIKSLAEGQGYKKLEACEAFCINCGIYYTSSMFAILSAHKRGEDTIIWSDNIMKAIYFWFDEEDNGNT